MRIGRGFLPLVVALAVGCGKEGAVEPPSPAPVTVRGVAVSTVVLQKFPETVEAVGSLKARRSAALAARVSGTVTTVYVAEGARVARGSLLLAIDSPESLAAAAGALSGVQEAERGVEEARARQRLAEATFERFGNLYAEQAVTRQEFDERRMEKESAAQGVARAEARLAQARHAARGAAAVAGYGTVSSPLAGIVVRKDAEAGQTVFPGTPLITVEGEDGVRLEVAAPESLLGKVHRGDRVPVLLEGVPAGGEVSEIVPAVDRGSRTFLVKIDVQGKSLRSGSYGKAFFPVGERQGIALPRGALVERGGLTSVWAVTPQGIARLRLVKLGIPLGESVEVISGIAPGERIVTGGAAKVVDGAKVL